MITIVKLNEEQWAQIKSDVNISSYGPKETFFDSIEEIITADKVVTLNGRPMWKEESAVNPLERRIELYHKIFELPNGKFAVSSQTFNQDISIKKLNIDNDQIKYYEISTHKIYESKDFNHPNPDSMRNSPIQVPPGWL